MLYKFLDEEIETATNIQQNKQTATARINDIAAPPSQHAGIQQSPCNVHIDIHSMIQFSQRKITKKIQEGGKESERCT